MIRFAAALEAFDRRLRDGDAIITADHDNDPTFRGDDHTREPALILVFRPGIGGGSIGRRETLADIGATIAVYLGLPPGPYGRHFAP